MKKTIEELKEKIQSRYANNLRSRDFWQNESNNEREHNHQKKANELQQFADEYQEAMNEDAQIYAFLMDIDWVDAIKELREYAYNHK